MNIERMEMFHDLLMDLPGKLPKIKMFNMGSWVENNAQPDPDDGDYVQVGKTLECGTSACALGCAALYPAFIEQGLIWSLSNGVEFKGSSFETAGKDFFNLTNEQSDNLFFTYYEDKKHTKRTTPQYIASLIREMVEEETGVPFEMVQKVSRTDELIAAMARGEKIPCDEKEYVSE